MKYYVRGEIGDGKIREGHDFMYPIRDGAHVAFRGIGYQCLLTIIHETENTVLVHKPAYSAWFSRNTTANYPSQYLLFLKEPIGWRLKYQCEPGRFWKKLKMEMIKKANEISENQT